MKIIRHNDRKWQPLFNNFNAIAVRTPDGKYTLVTGLISVCSMLHFATIGHRDYSDYKVVTGLKGKTTTVVVNTRRGTYRVYTDHTVNGHSRACLASLKKLAGNKKAKSLNKLL
jgi:hypothetical protein